MGKKVDVSEIGKKGGEARAANMTAKERSESARAAVLARWAKVKGESGDVGKKVTAKKRKAGK
jgi:hypothetical protein